MRYRKSRPRNPINIFCDIDFNKKKKEKKRKGDVFFLKMQYNNTFDCNIDTV